MQKFYMVVREGACSSHGGQFRTLQEAKNFASEASIKHLKNDGYIVLEAIHYTQSTVSVYTNDYKIDGDSN